MNGKYLLIGFMALLVLAGIVAASTPINASVSAGPQQRYAIPHGAAGSVTTEGGNVTQVNLTGTNSSTERWAGFYGNLTGSNLVLGDSSGNAFYAWAVGNPNELWKVYASTQNDVNWANLAAGQCEAGTNVYNWVFNGAWADNYTNTFTHSGADTFADATITANYTLTYEHNGAETWPTYHLQDGTGTDDDVWAAKVLTTATAFNDAAGVVYQLMVPANPADNTYVTYYFFLEIN